MIIRGEKVNLRPVEPADLERMVAWSQDPELAEYTEGNYPCSMEEAASWLQRVRSDRHNKRWSIVTKQGLLIGDIELDQIAWRGAHAELRICIGEKAYWNQGLGTDAVRAVVAHAFENMSLEQVYLRVFADNARAVRCYLKAGFRKEGRIERRDPAGRPRQVLLMRVLRSEYLRSGYPSEQGEPGTDSLRQTAS
ncbi:MAG: GNAT family N-acetyltransferase [Firmicutes bacterium]|jgi:RimJ/RimL family protein N-acetyltransferase|nr:GNAT family N-acetyltransferase [Bacillota bacterium]